MSRCCNQHRSAILQPSHCWCRYFSITRDRNEAARHPNKIRKRQEVVEQSLHNLITYYAANVTLGTPPQVLELLIETSSSDLVVNVPSSEQCQQAGACVGGTYEPSSSSTYSWINDDFNINYQDGTALSGNYSSDVLNFGGVSLDGFQFGVGESSTTPNNILGIGYAGNAVQSQDGGTYPNLPLALVNGGHIKSNAYSLWLNDLNAHTGSILFGGVDRARYQGNFVTRTISGTNGAYALPSIDITGLGINGQNLSSSSYL